MQKIPSKLYLIIFLVILFICTGRAQAPNGDYQFLKNIPYYEKSGENYKDSICTLDIYMPKSEKPVPVLVWFHGGGLTGGAKDLPKELMHQNFAVVTVGYRLYPKVSCPGYIKDAAAAIAWVFRHIGAYGGDSSKIVLSGHSAGGYLSMMTGMDPKWLAEYGVKNTSIAAIIPLSGQCITHFTIRKEHNIPEKQPIIDEYAPLFHVAKNLPPLILITGDREKELLGRYEENAYLARMMQLVDHPATKLHELEGFDHGGMVAPGCLLLTDYMRTLRKK